MIRQLLLLTLLLGFTFNCHAAWLGTWAKRMKIEVDNTNVDTSQTDFPLRINLSTSAGINSEDVSAVFDELTSDANRTKIAVTSSNGTTQQYVEIEQWDDANEVAELWTKVGTLVHDGVTTLYIYYDSAQAANTTYIGDIGSTPGEDVWDASYVGVYHMVTTNTVDSTDHSHDGTVSGNPTTDTSGIVNGDVRWANDADKDRVDLGSGISDAIDGQADVTLSAWYWLDTLGTASTADSCAFSKGQTTAGTVKPVLSWYNEDGNGATGGYSFNSGDASNGNNRVTTSVNATAEVWQHVVGTTDAADREVYLNGVSSNTGTGGETTVPVDAANDAWIGAWDRTGNFDVDGEIDEVRLSIIERTANYIKADYHSTKDNLNDFYAEEDIPATGVPQVIIIGG